MRRLMVKRAPMILWHPTLHAECLSARARADDVRLLVALCAATHVCYSYIVLLNFRFNNINGRTQT